MTTATEIQIQQPHSIPQMLKFAEEMIPEILAEAAQTDSPESFPAAAFEKFQSNGLLKIVLPREFGGAGLGIENGSTRELLGLLKTFGYGNLVVGRIYEGHFNAVQLIKEYASESQTKRIFTEAARENHLFGVWNTEAGDGVKIIALENNRFRLEGSKTFASGIDYVNRPIITGRLADGGWQMFILPLDEIQAKTDNSWWKPLGMQASRSYRIDLNGVEITANELIGQPNDYYREPFFSGGAIRFAAVQLGAAELLLDLTGEFLREIKRTDDGFQQMRAGEMAIAVESGNLFLAQAARLFDEFLAGQNAPDVARILNYGGMMRTAIEQICQDAMLRAARSIGSRGLMKNYPFERVLRDLTMYLRQAAPDATLINVGRYVLENETPVRKLWEKGND